MQAVRAALTSVPRAQCLHHCPTALNMSIGQASQPSWSALGRCPGAQLLHVTPAALNGEAAQGKQASCVLLGYVPLAQRVHVTPTRLTSPALHLPHVMPVFGSAALSTQQSFGSSASKIEG